MAEIEDLLVKLQADNTQLISEFKSTNDALKKSVDKMSQDFQKFAEDGEKSTSFLNGAMKVFAGTLAADLAKGAVGLAADALKGLFNIFKEGVIDAAATQAALNDVVSAVSRSGHASAETAVFFEEMANSLQDSTGVSDDLILKSAALAASLTKLGEQDVKKVTTAAIDLSAALGIDLNSATSIVSKAVDGNAAALKKYGVEIQTTGDKTKDLELVTKALNNQFGGAAASKLQTTSGAFTNLTNQFADFAKEAGNIVVKNPATVAALNGLAEIFRQMGAWIKENAYALRVAFAEALAYVVERAGAVVGALNLMFQAVGSDALQGATDALGEYSAKMDEAANTTASGAEVMVTAQQGQGAQLAELTAAQEAYNAKLTEFATALSNTGLTQAYAMELENIKINLEQGTLSQEEAMLAREELLAQQYAKENQMLSEARANNLITEQQYQDATTNLALTTDQKQRQLQTERLKYDQKQSEQRLQQTSQFFGNLSTLSQTGNKQLGAIGKAAAIAQATVDTYAGANKAMAQGGIFGFALAASVVAAGLVNVAKIASTPLATGIDSVPGIGNADNFPAVLAPGERVVPSETNKDLTNFLSEDGGKGTTINVSVVMNDVWTTDPNELGLKIIETINRAAQANGIKTLGSTVV